MPRRSFYPAKAHTAVVRARTNELHAEAAILRLHHRVELTRPTDPHARANWLREHVRGGVLRFGRSYCFADAEEALAFMMRWG